MMRLQVILLHGRQPAARSSCAAARHTAQHNAGSATLLADVGS